MVSIDGDEQGNDAHRKTGSGEGTYRKVRANLGILIERMRTHGVRLPKLRATLSAQNPDPIAVERHLLTLGTPLVQVGETHGTVEGGGKDHDLVAQQARTARARVDEHIAAALAALELDPGAMPPLVPSIVEGLRRIHEKLTSTEVHAHARPSLCGVCRNMKAVTPKGDLYPCHRYVGMEAFKFGNMHEGGLDQSKVHDYYDRIYSSFEEKCTSCWARHLCGGQCPWYLSRQDGTVAAPDDDGCDMIRSGTEARLGLYALLLERFPDAFRKLLGAAASDVRGEQGKEITLDHRCGC
jgi:radical SAM protein with 4Fe4S-binding SPASM domain